MDDYATKVLLSGRRFLEGPRWHAGEIWLSDIPARQVLAVTPAGHARILAELDDKASGLGFLPDGTALVVSVGKMQVRRVADHSVYADISHLMAGGANDMFVTTNGRAYVGSFGYDVFGGAPEAPGQIVLIERDGSTRIVADGIGFPNGMALTNEVTADDTRNDTQHQTLLVAATHENRILEYDIGADGSLSDRRVWAEVSGQPDGIALDSEGALWVALSGNATFERVRRGGKVLDRIAIRPGWHAIACTFGGEDLRSLYLTTAVWDPTRDAALEVAQVDVPGQRLERTG